MIRTNLLQQQTCSVKHNKQSSLVPSFICKAGSTYTYVYVLLGEMPAFLAGWSILLEYVLSISTVARGWSSSLNALTGGAIGNWTTEHVGRYDIAIP